MDTLVEIDQLHAKACIEGLDSYLDPKTGYKVCTAIGHEARGYCCGCACRHCPFDYEKVNATLKKQLLPDPFFFNYKKSDEVDLLFWSGGKDSFLSLHKLKKESLRNVVLLTSFDLATDALVEQGVELTDVKEQVLKMDGSIMFVPLSANTDYSKRIELAIVLLSLRTKVRRLVFGDLHLPSIRKWRDHNFRSFTTPNKIDSHYPLWHRNYNDLIAEFESTGAKSYVSAVRDTNLKKHLKEGDEFSRELCARIPDEYDKFGENGEYHTIVDPPVNFMTEIK